MHEVILRKNKELGFCQVLNGEDLTHDTKIRRIAVGRNTDCSVENVKKSKLRSVLFSDVDKVPDSFMSAFVGNFKLLKVVDFENAALECLPEAVGKLFHLQYLSLRNTKVKILPKAIGKLVNLETLDLRDSLLSELPIEIQNVKKLRHLTAHIDYYTAVKIQKGLGSLTELRRLEFVEVNSEVLGELRKLGQLRRMKISVKSNDDVKDLLACTGRMEKLEYLTVDVTTAKEALDIQSVDSPPQSLQCFILRSRCRIKKLPDWIFELKNLVMLGLYFDGSIVDPLRALEALPNLLTLALGGIDSVEQLHFKEGWFQKLQRLNLRDTKRLKLMIIDKGTMPNLKQIFIGPCPLLKEIPTGIQHLRNLKTLLFRNMVREIDSMIKSENWEKVTHHIPEVGVTYHRRGKLNYFYRTKYLSSLSPQDFEQLYKGEDTSSEQSNP